METYTINKIHDKMELDLQVGTKELQKTIVVLKPSPNMFQRLLLVNLATYFKHLDLLDALYGKIVATTIYFFIKYEFKCDMLMIFVPSY